MGTMRARRYQNAAVARASLARFFILLGTAVAAVLILGIGLVVLEANPNNGMGGAVRDAARSPAGPFDGLFTLDSSKAEKAVNWGIAAVVWYAIARLIARLLVRR